jgi:hypothetical protein
LRVVNAENTCPENRALILVKRVRFYLDLSFLTLITSRFVYRMVVLADRLLNRPSKWRAAVSVDYIYSA